VQDGAFQQQISLNHEGQIRITASVSDGSGNSSVAQRNIIRIDRILGDLNGDGCVDIRDAAAVLRISLGMDPVTPQALAHADVAPLVNGVPMPDGKIDVGDVLVLLRKIVGLVDF
jgi:large repetitive protein